jgi:hypothetical protein
LSLPFTVEEFLRVFERYNLAVWPMQWVLYALGIAAVILAFWRADRASRIISFILAFLWLWMGGVYHLTFFTSINRAAFFFGLIFILQAALFFYVGVWEGKLSFGIYFDSSGITGAILLVYAMLIYPALAILFGHRYPATPTFGLPCPTTIFTFGLLIWTNQRVPRLLLIIPLIWSAVGFSAALLLKVTEDFGLPVAGMLSLLLLGMHNRKHSHRDGERSPEIG